MTEEVGVGVVADSAMEEAGIVGATQDADVRQSEALVAAVAGCARRLDVLHPFRGAPTALTNFHHPLDAGSLSGQFTSNVQNTGSVSYAELHNPIKKCAFKNQVGYLQ